jgi:hypothetical protein
VGHVAFTDIEADQLLGLLGQWFPPAGLIYAQRSCKSPSRSTGILKDEVAKSESYSRRCVALSTTSSAKYPTTNTLPTSNRSRKDIRCRILILSQLSQGPLCCPKPRFPCTRPSTANRPFLTFFALSPGFLTSHHRTLFRLPSPRLWTLSLYHRNWCPRPCTGRHGACCWLPL